MPIAPKRLKLQTSNLTCVFSGTVRIWPFEIFPKGAWPGSRDPLNFGALNANNSKTVKATDFKFDECVFSDSPYMTSLKYSKKGAWPGSRDPLNFLFSLASRRKYFEQPLKWAWPWTRDPLNFWALNANSSKTDFKFDVCFQGQSVYDPLKFFQKGRGQGHVTP